MPSPAWREEKSEKVVQELCLILSLDNLAQEVRAGIEAALWDALKLLANSIEEGLGNRQARWSPALVKIFLDQPKQCSQWIELMSEPNFSAEDYWKK